MHMHLFIIRGSHAALTHMCFGEFWSARRRRICLGSFGFRAPPSMYVCGVSCWGRSGEEYQNDVGCVKKSSKSHRVREQILKNIKKLERMNTRTLKLSNVRTSECAKIVARSCTPFYFNQQQQKSDLLTFGSTPGRPRAL